MSACISIWSFVWYISLSRSRSWARVEQQQQHIYINKWIRAFFLPSSSSSTWWLEKKNWDHKPFITIARCAKKDTIMNSLRENNKLKPIHSIILQNKIKEKRENKKKIVFNKCTWLEILSKSTIRIPQKGRNKKNTRSRFFWAHSQLQ